MSYTNTTKDAIPLVYPLSMPVKWVDDTINFRSTGYRGFARSGGFRASESNEIMHGYQIYV